MKRTNWLLLLGFLASGWLAAQTMTNITIGTNATGNPGPVFQVDGTSYTTPQTFNWPSGSAHTVTFPLSVDQNGNTTGYQSAQFDNIRFTFGGWQTNTGLSYNSIYPTISVTAQPSLTSMIAQVTTSYLVTINNPNGTACGNANDNSLVTAPEGVSWFNGTCEVAGTYSQYLTAGTYPIEAYPLPGYVFYGWLINGEQQYALTSVTINGPLNITPQFSIAKRVFFLTSPPSLQVLVDGAAINTPQSYQLANGGTCTPDVTRIPPNAPPGFTPICVGEVDFLPGSVHTIGAPTPQSDASGTVWTFSAFNNGMTENSQYTAGTNINTIDTLTANFIPGVHATVQTNPQGLKIMIDGRDNWPAYVFTWGQGTTHTLAAETPQTDASGRVWQFSSWSDNGAASHTVTAPTNSISYYVTATYVELEQVTITSSPTGLTFTVDGNSCTTPCVVNKAAGSTSTITAPTQVPYSGGSRYNFLSWSDGSTSASRTVTYSQNTLILTASYLTQYQLTTVSNPANSATFQVSPSSPDGYYNSGTQVQIAATANSGYKFVKWEGNLSGTTPSGALTMNSPMTVQADTQSAPTIPPAGIESATGPTPDGSLAAGSLIAIYGSNLAPAFQLGATNPLSQTINNVTVTVGNYILPLQFVSPTQIGAQLPWEIAPGSYTLTVHQTGQPDVPGNITVSRDAPGIFTEVNTQNLPIAVALHHDGSLVTLTSPVVQGEQITIYGTGFGPYVTPAVDGFATDPTQNSAAVDPVSVSIGGVQLTPDYAGSEPNMVGVAIVKVTITPGTPTATNANLIVTVGGKPSSTVLLPMQ